MIRSIGTGLLCVIAVGMVGILPIACQSGGVGDPCTPEDEYDPAFGGFKVTEENIESRSFQCQTRICLVNHFQGRVSCPLGQDPMQITFCNATHPCAQGKCKNVSTVATPCDPTKNNMSGGNPDCGGTLTCNKAGGFCQCNQDADCVDISLGAANGVGLFCDASTHICTAGICHTEGDCQSADNTTAQNTDTVNGLKQPKPCCVPGGDANGDVPVAVGVCGQCTGGSGMTSTRNGDQAVYCSCRCDVADGQPPEPDFNFCKCPSGFSCTQIRANVGLGDAELTGKYCIKEGTQFVDATTQCGNVLGAFPMGECSGTQQTL